jgi:hypothetical protein
MRSTFQPGAEEPEWVELHNQMAVDLDICGMASMIFQQTSSSEELTSWSSPLILAD